MKAFLFGVVALLVASPLGAPRWDTIPQQSPYRDLEYRQELTPLGGYVRARHDPAGVSPQSAAMPGCATSSYLAGPLALSADLVARCFSERDVLDPAKPPATRVVGTETTPVYAADLALALEPHGTQELAPSRAAGARGPWPRHERAQRTTRRDYTFGTPFAFTFGGGLKFVPGGRLQLRADVDRARVQADVPRLVLSDGQRQHGGAHDSTPRSFYTHHAASHAGRVVPLRALSRRAAGRPFSPAAIHGARLRRHAQHRPARRSRAPRSRARTARGAHRRSTSTTSRSTSQTARVAHGPRGNGRRAADRRARPHRRARHRRTSRTIS